MMNWKVFANIIRIAIAISCIALCISIHLFARNAPSFTPPLSRQQALVWPSDTVQSKLPFVVDSLCFVADPAHALDAFFAGLDSLSAGCDTVLTIVHLGDSHIQAGHYSGRSMRLLQQQYGNAGRGWIAPFKIGGSNEPDDYFISTLIKEWTTGRCIQRTQRCPIGPGGIGIQTPAPFVNFDISIAPNNGAGYAFNQVIVYRGEKSMPMRAAGKLRDSAEVLAGGQLPALKMIADTIRLAGLTDSLQLQSTRRQPGTDLLLPAESFDNLYYGFSLTNGAPGILYHAIGVNGSMFVNYTDDHYVRQLAMLRPSLLIISLGTNESFGRRFTTNEFSGQIEAFLSLAKKHMPHTAILFTTPPECYKRVVIDKQRRYVRNENTERVARSIIRVAEKEGAAYWDLFAATGGRKSSENWFNGKWMGRDRIHFNKEAYQEQGVLLFKALMNLKKKNETAYEYE
ncbi:MAG: GDSL-type esterase/lipase family protein [Tannerellaceae bacterium]|jgi:lysophospholipase L1-like esterase|nr:GDSL-type esterase/lipase family protein [Tannerellaceae bacterium]